MRSLSSQMLAYLQEPVITLATLALIQRTDGINLAFTSWDVPITYGGYTYSPGLAASPSTIKTNSDGTTDQMDVIGAIDSNLILEADLDGGRYDMALITICRVCPFNLSYGQITDLVGYMGQIDYGDGKFQAAINSIGNLFTQSFGDIITPTCRVRQLGDSQCKVNIATYTFSGTITSTNGSSVLVFNDTNTTSFYDYGMVIWNTISASGGANNNLKMEVKTSVSNGHYILTLKTTSSLIGTLSGGTFNVSVNINGGAAQTTTPIAYNASAATLQAALQALSNVGSGNMTVSGSAGGPYTVTSAGTLTGVVVQITADGTLLEYTLSGVISDAEPDFVAVTSSGGSSMTVYLVEPMPFVINVGDEFTIQAGCDRAPLTCRNKFNNLVNIHCEPYVPGNDYLLTTPT